MVASRDQVRAIVAQAINEGADRDAAIQYAAALFDVTVECVRDAITEEETACSS